MRFCSLLAGKRKPRPGLGVGPFSPKQPAVRRRRWRRAHFGFTGLKACSLAAYLSFYERCFLFLRGVGVFVCCSVAPFRCGGRVVVSVAFLRQCVTEKVYSLTACPAGGHFLYRQKVTKERLKGFALKKPTRGFPLDLPADGANAPYPFIPAGLFVFPAGGRPPPAYGLRGRRRAAGGVGVLASLVK